MPTPAARVNSPARSHDPLKPLAEAIGSMLADVAGKNQVALSLKLSRALHQVLEARTPQSRSARLLLIRHLVDIESQDAGIEISEFIATPASDLIGTAQAAELLGYSRPHVAMLIDQNQIKGATVSKGGHRRVSRAAVMQWKEQNQASGRGVDLRTEGDKIGAYQSPEAEVVHRVKALAKQR
jgi:excisionase family DNA binding protein